MSNQETAQTTLLHNATRDAARKAAIARIEQIMLPGARALAGTRTPESSYWIERSHELKGTAPFGDRRVSLYWKDQGSSVGTQTVQVREPFDTGGRITYSARVYVADSVGPELLAELARIAAILTAQIVRECEALTTAQCAALDAEAHALEQVGYDLHLAGQDRP